MSFQRLVVAGVFTAGLFTAGCGSSPEPTPPPLRRRRPLSPRIGVIISDERDSV